jgi:hypothetical protein
VEMFGKPIGCDKKWRGHGVSFFRRRLCGRDD